MKFLKMKIQYYTTLLLNIPDQSEISPAHLEKKSLEDLDYQIGLKSEIIKCEQLL
jgi:hypothetical protein